MSLLDRLERVGNRLPDPATLFVAGALLVAVASQLAVSCGWEVEKTVTRDVREPLRAADGAPVLDAAGQPVTRPVLDPATGLARRERVTETVRAKSLLSSDGVYWALGSMVDNFKNFPPLAIVLVGMLGIGLADRTGFVGAALKALLLRVPGAALSPAVMFLGVMSSIGLDAGYVVLPPVAAAMYAAVGRSPLAGLAAAFAGVAAGFSANLTVTSLDTLLMGFTTAAASLVDPAYVVGPRANLRFMQASTLLLTGVGWAVTALWVEPRLSRRPPADGGPSRGADAASLLVTPDERRGLAAGLGAAALVALLLALAVFVPGAPLHGTGANGAPRWVTVIVPLLFLCFFVPGAAYGVASGALRSDRDVARTLGDTMAAMGSYLVLAFFCAQFIEWFRYSGLGEMFALAGGRLLASAALPTPVLLVAFVGVVAFANLFMASMSAKYAFFAPVFVPMFMQVGISPELTQATYRVGDSITNVVTPLNPYLVILLVSLTRYVPNGGLGTLLALMVPYAVAFGIVWSVFLAAWVALGVPVGPEGPLVYAPGAQ